ncbi:MAG: tail fiber domain-containing protein [Bacteroidia bacterium]|nr:tail fiber domain-containing protein [Bacteroidia bacterium]
MRSSLKLFLVIFSMALTMSSAFAQVPQGISLQAVARDASGIPYSFSPITVGIRLKNAAGTIQYEETHSVLTDQYGLFNVIMGQGTPVSGTFSAIDWAASQHKVQILINNTALTERDLQSVPYALEAGKVNMTLDDIADIDMTGLSTGQSLSWDGTQWVPASFSGEIWQVNGNNNYYNDGRVAIGLDTPKATLHLRDTANVLFGNDLTGSGFKFLYYGAKGALRVGYLNNPFGGYNYNKFWDYDSVGYYSFAAGQNSRAKGFGAFAFGSFGWADGSSSVAFFGSATGNNSYTFGGSSKGRGSFTVEGVADEEGGIAMYGYTGGRYGVSIGGGTTGLGASSSREDYAIAIGWNSDARGQASIALGPSDAYGYNSFSTGWVTEARGNYSSTFGYQTNSYPYASMALGRFNVINGDSAAWVTTDPIFMIGDGTSNTNRSNSFVIQKNGQTAVGYNSPTGMLNVSSALGSLSNGGLDPSRASILIGSSTSGLAFDANQIESIGGTLFVNFNSTQDVDLVVGGGNVGIGHNAPAAKLDVESTGWQFRLENTAAGGSSWYMGAAASTWAAGSDKFLIGNSATSSNASLAIGTDRQVGIGTLNPTDRLHVNSATGEDAFRAQVNGVTAFRVHDNLGASVGANLTPPTNGLRVSGQSNFGDDIYPNADNSYDVGAPTRRWDNVWATNGIIQTSDGRLKKNIAALNYGLATISQLRPVSFEWISGVQGEKKIGLIAQDLQKVVPEVVKSHQDPEVPLGVNYAELVPILIKGMQEQQEMIEKQQLEMLELKGRLKKLEDKLSNKDQ